ncbi:multicopper oxidase domain-containing protein [Jiulongibacter sediminis]|uniref:Copper oxidase n=1 Tax=Jiulongibacter sediminis TaxID=1605367 RepID=A0A0N8HAA7_9BACT|nr:multicopper oxidase domain-containing protein [Jiulongibacter sediminis]KPM49644.1 copper oxidase [Jiulongibacter sediminis]TBX26682.1 copper oxidase [Jiulongibacter sediminis]
MSKLTLLVGLTLLFSGNSLAQVGTNGQDRLEKGRPVKRYELTIASGKVTLAGVTSHGMTVNGSVPGPTLEFTEGDLAVITVFNKMDVETSVHWHGLILPNFYDGVPYLTTPPIKPHSSFEYRIPLNQSGTYWYHSHTMLQEQKGVYGSIVIKEKEPSLVYDRDIVFLLSDWTGERSEHVLKNLKRGNEWYQVKKKTAVPLNRVIGRGALGAQLKFWRDRMEGADIADIYYPAFLTNGQRIDSHPNLTPGEKVRLRMINASASTYFWVDFGGGNPRIVSSDGVDVQPVHKNRFLFAIAETYDIILTVPEEGTLEITATAQDGSGHTSMHLGHGDLLPAKVISRPDKIAMMKQMSTMDMKMGAPTIISNPLKKTPEFLKKKYGMSMKDNMKPEAMMNDGMKVQMSMNPKSHEMNHEMSMETDSGSFDYQQRKTYFNYDFLTAKDSTMVDPGIKVNEMLLNLTGNMNRYIWSINGKPLSEADKIKIKGGEVTRITLNNLTMMHHPMHLHGHYFRVINAQGDHSPLKHTVNVPPMKQVTIEFYNEEYGDWFFHCHVLYHMMGGMARVFSYDTERDDRMKPFPVKNLIHETDRFYSWGTARLGSNFNEIRLTSSSIRNEFNAMAEADYSGKVELQADYSYYLNDWVRLYAGVNSENEGTSEPFNTVALAGLRYFMPYMFSLDFSLDHQLRPRVRLDRELLLFPRLFLEAEYDYRADFGWINKTEGVSEYQGETEWLIGVSYILSKNFSIQANYNNLYGWGGGLLLRF